MRFSKRESWLALCSCALWLAACGTETSETVHGGTDDAGVDPCEGKETQHYCLDGDGDAHGDATKTLDDCDPPAGYVTACDDTDDGQAAVFPGAPELCDGLDNDGNGQSDDRASGPCECMDGAEEACGSAVGACTQGTRTCSDGAWGECTGGVTAGAETCNGADDDCNGTVDDTGATEACNGADDDCDGQADEGLGVGDACVVGVGACRAEGVNACSAAGQIACDATAGAPAAESCNGIDDDCNGLVDDAEGGCDCEDGATFECGSDVGVCQRGTQTCVDGHLGACEGGTAPSAEACNALDDDCNGTADDRAGAACNCTDGAQRPCGSAVGACMQGTQTCVNGDWGMCAGGVAPAPETCNGADDDCNGMNDDRAGDACECVDGAMQACGSSVGLCMQGTQSCANGHWSDCQGGVAPVGEVFDGRDNDCNGTNDDDLPLGLVFRVRTAPDGPRNYYAKAFADMPMGELTVDDTFVEGGNDDDYFMNGDLFRFNRDNQTWSRYSVAVDGGDYAHPRLVLDEANQLSIANLGYGTRFAYLSQVAEDLAIGYGFASPNGSFPSFYRWNPQTMQLVGDAIEADFTRPYYGAAVPSPGVIWGDYLVTNLRWVKNSAQVGQVGYPNLAVGLVRTDGSQPMIVVEDPTGRCTAGNDPPFVDANGDLYVAGNGAIVLPYGSVSPNPDVVAPTPSPPSCVLRIRAGQQQFDPDFFVNLTTATQTCQIRQIQHVSGHTVLVTGVANADCAGVNVSNYRNQLNTNYFVDLDTGMGYVAPGMPKLYEFLASEYHYRGGLYFQGFVRVQATIDGVFNDSQIEVYRIDEQTLAVERVFETTGGDLIGLGPLKVR
jgi:hypothetical protein